MTYFYLILVVTSTSLLTVIICESEIIHEQLYKKLSSAALAHIYTTSIKNGSADSRIVCAHLCLVKRCGAFQYKDNGECELFRLEDGPGAGIINMTGRKGVLIGKVCLMCIIRERK